MKYPITISKEEITKLPLLQFNGEIHVIEDHKSMFQAIRQLGKQTIIGFDTEKKPTFKKGQYHATALIQLSTSEDAFLFRINKLGFHEELKALLESKDIIKVGIGMKDDLVELQMISTFSPQNCIDLNEVIPTLGIEKVVVRNLAGIFLEKRVSKNQQVSNWENDLLTESQMHYAAADACVCFEIYSLLKLNGYL